MTAPADPEGERHVIWVADVTVTEVHELAPKVTVAPVRNPVPVIVTEVPPSSAPVVGETELTVGAGLALVMSNELLVALVSPPDEAVKV